MTGSEPARERRSSQIRIARYLDANRVDIGDRIANRNVHGHNLSVTRLMMRACVGAMALAIEKADPDVMVHWSRAAKDTYGSRTVRAAVASAISEAAASSVAGEGSLAWLLVFLEIVRTRVDERAFPEQGPQPREAAVIETLLTMLRTRDEATCAHSHATGLWCQRLTEALGLSTVISTRIVKAGVLHDIGKVGTPEAILLKDGPLDDDEWKIMRRHAAFGAEILAGIPALAHYAPIVRSHHERIDGKGYPDGLSGEEISIEARVVAVADALHAMISDRPYRRALRIGDAMDVLRRGRGTQWDAGIVDVMTGLVAAERSRSIEEDLSNALGAAPLHWFDEVAGNARLSES